MHKNNLYNMQNYLKYTLFFFTMAHYSQTIVTKDSVQKLKTVYIFTENKSIIRFKDVENNTIYSGKKNEIIDLTATSANLTTNNSREAFAKIPGLSIWESDGSGIQINIAVRGLSPNRSWEFNTRQNGYDISSDVFGYPEAYYNPPLQAVSKLQLVRGGASLQFGSQFGGMLNYVLKRENTKPFSFETQNTVGSYGLFSSYNAIGGQLKKIRYYVYNDSRSADNWRQNSKYAIRNSHVFFEYKFSDSTKISAEYTNMDYQMQQPGGLTDIQFATNAQQSSRSRNWFGTPWNLFAINFDANFGKKLTFNAKVFGLVGQRNSVGFVAPLTTIDAINPTTLEYSKRQIDRDFYNNIGLETRNVLTYNLFEKNNHHLAFGTRLYSAHTTRKQMGFGTSASDFDLQTTTDFSRNLDFSTKNLSLFVENQFKVTDQFSATPGFRFEHITSSISGQFGVSNGNTILVADNKITRNRMLFGLGLEYKFEKTEIYTNFSQAFRPVLFSDTTPPATTDVIDPNLTDASGYNFDLGFRGNAFGFLNFDISYFYIKYDNKIGTLRKFVNNDISKNTYQFRTNLGTAIHQGFEGFGEININKALKIAAEKSSFSFFSSLSIIEALYDNFEINTPTGSAPNIKIITTNLAGKRVENAPRYIHSFGLSYRYKDFSSTIQNRMQGMIFTDANNTETPSSTATTGALAGFSVIDLSMGFKFLDKYNLKAGINNLSDATYATRRSGGYPGPGILPNDARTFYISVGAKF